MDGPQIFVFPYEDPVVHPSKVWVDLTGPHLRLETDFGLVVQFDGNWDVIVQLPAAASDHVDGLCRNFDSDLTNEFILPGGTVASTPSALGIYFQVPDPEDPE